MKKLIAALTTAIFAVALVVVGAAAPASAHTPTLAGVSTCDSSTGKWSVTWTFATTNVPKGVKGSSKVTTFSPSTSTLSSTSGVGTGKNLTFSTTGNSTVKLTQTNILAGSTSATLSVHTDWSDRASGTASATAPLSGKCGQPTPPPIPKLASASVHTTPPTCSAGEKIVLGTLVHATWLKKSVSTAYYTVVAKARSGYKFAAGPHVTSHGSIDTFTGPLASKLSSNDPKCVTTVTVTPGTPTASDETCLAGNTVGGSITVGNQTGLVYTITGGPSNITITPAVGTTTNLHPGTYTVTAAVDSSSNPKYVLAAGSTTSFPLVVGAAVNCRSISLTASSTDAVCSSTPTGATPLTYVPGTITITPDADVTYTISDGTTTTPVTSSVTNVNAGTYTVTAQLTTAAQNAGAVLPVSSWGPFVIPPVNCTVATALVGDPAASSCFNLTSDTTLLSWVHADTTEHVSYQIFPAGNPSAATALADGYTSELPGDYTVVATADNGYTLDIAGDTSSVTAQWNVTVADISNCLPTGATWHAGASADPAVCVSSTSQLGTIQLTHLASEIGQVDYTITNTTTNAVIHAGSSATSVKVGPGTYVVTAAAVTTGDGISTASTFNLVVDAAAAACGTLSTLAFTGMSASVGILGLLLAGGMLFLGLATVFIRLASRRSAV